MKIHALLTGIFSSFLFGKSNADYSQIEENCGPEFATKIAYHLKNPIENFVLPRSTSVACIEAVSNFCKVRIDETKINVSFKGDSIELLKDFPSCMSLTELTLRRVSASTITDASVIGVLSTVRKFTYAERYVITTEAESLSLLVLQMDAALEELEFVDNRFHPEGIRVLMETVGSVSGLQALTFNGNNLRGVGSRSIAEALENLVQLKKLDLSGNHLLPFTFTLVADRLKHCHQLNYLDLSNNFDYSRPKTSRHLADALSHLGNLQYLDLSSNSLTEEDAHELAPAFRSLFNLNVLRLSYNNLGVNGMIYFEPSLLVMKRLTDLEISGNNLGPDGIGLLFSGLSNSNLLKNLIVESNDIGETGAKKIAQYLLSKVGMPSLMKFDLAFNGIGVRGLLEIVIVLKNYRNLKFLDISSNDVSDKDFHMISNPLSSLTALIKIESSGQYKQL